MRKNTYVFGVESTVDWEPGKVYWRVIARWPGYGAWMPSLHAAIFQWFGMLFRR